MNGPKPIAQCPSCKGVREVRRHGDEWVLITHKVAWRWCSGGSVSTDDVLKWSKTILSDAKALVNGRDLAIGLENERHKNALADIEKRTERARADELAAAKLVARIEKTRNGGAK